MTLLKGTLENMPLIALILRRASGAETGLGRHTEARPAGSKSGRHCAQLWVRQCLPFESVKLKLSCKAKPTATSTIHVLVLGFAWITLVSGTGILKAVPLRRALFLMGTLPGCGSQHIYTTIVDGLMDRHGCI